MEIISLIYFGINIFFADNSHLFSIILGDQSIKWYVDNHLYNEIAITPPSLSEFHKDFFIILNVAVGGNWPGPQDSKTVFPQKLEVDYIKIFKEEPNSVESESNLPNKFNLYQNYPNPFNPMTVIDFSLPLDVNNVNLSIYSSLGEKVAELVNSSLIAGKYSYTWNAQNIATGMYFYELRADDFIPVKKMVLLK